MLLFPFIIPEPEDAMVKRSLAKEVLNYATRSKSATKIGDKGSSIYPSWRDPQIWLPKAYAMYLCAPFVERETCIRMHSREKEYVLYVLLCTVSFVPS